MNAGQDLDTTCSAVLNATWFSVIDAVSDWQGFQYFRNLVNVEIDGDQAVYPVLPATVKSLTISSNVLSGANFPVLPPTLEKLDINSGSLDVLPALPVTLTHLRCYSLIFKPYQPCRRDLLRCGSLQICLPVYHILCLQDWIRLIAVVMQCPMHFRVCHQV